MSDLQHRAVIYCRVSSAKQATEGHGLESQESRCRDYAGTKGYDVEAVFPDDASGGGDFMNRPGMVVLLSYLDAQKDKSYGVILDDLKRFARDTEFHLKLRNAFRSRGARVECLNFKFDDSPEGKFFETILAAQGTLEREQNGRQVVQKMQARMKAGYWVFATPIGYRYDKIKGHGKLLVRDEPVASILADALEGFAVGRFTSTAEVKRHLDAIPELPKPKSGEVQIQSLQLILPRIIYTGMIDHAPWKISLVQGHHEPLISFDTHQKIIERLEGRAYAPTRMDLNRDFPLRGAVSCACCGHMLTAAWSKGRNKRHPYYKCRIKTWDAYGKSIRRDEIEGQFEKLLRQLRPAPVLFRLVREMLRDLWNERRIQGKSGKQTIKSEITARTKKIENLIERVIEADSPILIKANEKQIRKLEEDRIGLEQKLRQPDRPQAEFGLIVRTALEFLSSPWKLWISGTFEH